MSIGELMAENSELAQWSALVIYLRGMPIPARRKKQVIVEWCRIKNHALTKEMVREVIGMDSTSY
jgi:hypothetical protein